MHRRLMLLLCASLISSAALAQAPTGKVTVITSFSKEVTDPIKIRKKPTPSAIASR